jgi:hypothetical protein
MSESENIFVEPRDVGPGGAASVFRFRLHDPKSYCRVVSALREVERKLPFGNKAKVTAIEIAFDAYSKAANDRELADQAARFYRYCSLVVSENHRIYRKSTDGVKQIPFRLNSLVRHLADGWQIGIGDTTDAQYQHIYVKTTDNNGLELPVAKHRARIEIRLRDEALPNRYRYLDEWARADFEADLRMSAIFRKLKPKLGNYISAALEDTTLQVGERKRRWRAAKDGSGYSGDRLHRKSTVADSTLNIKARDAFRQLTTSWRRPER